MSRFPALSKKEQDLLRKALDEASTIILKFQVASFLTLTPGEQGIVADRLGIGTDTLLKFYKTVEGGSYYPRNLNSICEFIGEKNWRIFVSKNISPEHASLPDIESERENVREEHEQTPVDTTPAPPEVKDPKPFDTEKKLPRDSKLTRTLVPLSLSIILILFLGAAVIQLRGVNESTNGIWQAMKEMLSIAPKPVDYKEDAFVVKDLPQKDNVITLEQRQTVLEEGTSSINWDSVPIVTLKDSAINRPKRKAGHTSEKKTTILTDKEQADVSIYAVRNIKYDAPMAKVVKDWIEEMNFSASQSILKPDFFSSNSFEDAFEGSTAFIPESGIQNQTKYLCLLNCNQTFKRSDIYQNLILAIAEFNFVFVKSSNGSVQDSFRFTLTASGISEANAAAELEKLFYQELRNRKLVLK